MYRARGLTLRPRSREEFTRLFDGFEPGVSPAADWHPELGEAVRTESDDPIPGYAGVARKA